MSDLTNTPATRTRPSHQSQQSNFTISKWYMDCVGDDGRVFIGYAAALRWKKFIGIDYSSIITSTPAGEVREESALMGMRVPHMGPGTVTWNASRLHTTGQWDSLDGHFGRRLIHNSDGILDWTCIQPKARAHIQIKDGPPIQGLGYTERITMTIPPWNLPLSELRWGRFLSEDDTIVWINWSGETTMNMVFHQRKAVDNAVVTDEDILLDNDRRLVFHDTTVLREGPLISTALASIPGLREIFPGQLLHTYECKWRSRATLHKPDNTVSHGWAIHEVVRWNPA